jgi:hypothetical protein
MNWVQQIILWAALPLSIALIVIAVNALRAVNRAWGEGKDCDTN